MLQQFLQCLFYLYEKNDKCFFKTCTNIFEIILSIAYIKLQNEKKILEQIGKYTVYDYYVGERQYKILSKIKRGPNKYKVVGVQDDNGNDITEDVKSFLGPNEDWHRIPYTLQDFEWKRMTFFLQNEETVVVEDPNQILPSF